MCIQKNRHFFIIKITQCKQALIFMSNYRRYLERPRYTILRKSPITKEEGTFQFYLGISNDFPTRDRLKEMCLIA